jgi:hypothetical protein
LDRTGRALRERWPEIGRAVLSDPDVLGELEAAAADGDGVSKLHGAENVEELVELLQQPPELSPVIERLIYFMPAGVARPAGVNADP